MEQPASPATRLPLRTVALSVAMFAIFLVHELVQEIVTKTPGWRFGLFVTLVEVLACTTYPYLASALPFRRSRSNGPAQTLDASHAAPLQSPPATESPFGATAFLKSFRDFLRLATGRNIVAAAPSAASADALGAKETPSFRFRMLLIPSLPAAASMPFARAVWTGRLCLVSLCILLSISMGNLALVYCSYPAKVAFKARVRRGNDGTINSDF